MAMIESWFKQDLKKPVQVNMVKGNVFSGDNQGNLIGVTVTDEGEAADIGGTVSASIIRADGTTVAQAGTVIGNKCSVVLPSAAYAIPGSIIITLKLIQVSVITTLLCVVGTVYRTSTDTLVDPGTIIPSVEQLIAAIDDAVASIPSDYGALSKAVRDNGIIDIFNDGTYTDSTWRGITLTWDGKIADISGTASGGNYTSPNIYSNSNGFPNGITAGDIIDFNIEKTTENVYVNVFSYVNGSPANEAQISSTQRYKIPDNATGLLIRLLVYEGKTVSGNFSFGITKASTVSIHERVLPTMLPANDAVVETIEALLSEYGVVVLGKGTYYLKRAINMPDNSIIKGAGDATIIQAANGADAIIVGANCSIQNVRIHSEDGHTSSGGTTSGIKVVGNYESTPLKYNIKIDNVTIDGFSLAGIYGKATGTWVADSITASNCRIYNCYAGIFAEDYSEFGRYTNILCYNNYIGLLNKSGNNVFVNCSFSNNTVGVYLVGIDGDNSRNNGHGSVIGCTINHSNNNEGFAVICNGIDANGFIFDSCQIWYGKIQVEQSTGIIFNDCMFGAYNTNTEVINYTANDLFLMNCMFKVGATFSGTGGETHVINCFKFDGTPIVISN